MPKLDWKPNHDPESRKWGVARLGITTSTRSYRYWSPRSGPPLDQDEEGACVGHGVTGAIISAPFWVRLPNPQRTAFGMYYGSRRIDEWEGESYDGTSVNAGMKLARELGLIKEYSWCFGVEQLAATVLELGPVVIGVPWYESMYSTDDEALVKVAGSIVGGHCLYVNGYNVSRPVGDYTGKVFRWRNSWGPHYGDNGHAWVPYDTMAQLLAQDGEAAIPTKI